MPKNYDTWRMAAASYLTPKPASVLEEKLFAVIYQGLPEPKAMTAMSAERGPIGDIDNFAKAALDLLTKTGGIWRDDRQVALLLTEKGFTLTNVGTWIALVPMSEVPPCLQLRSTSPTPTSFSVCCERTLT